MGNAEQEQFDSMVNVQPINQDNKNVDKQSFCLSFVLGLLALETNSNDWQ